VWLSRVEEVEEGEGPAAYLDDEEEGYAETEGGLFSHGRGLYVLEWGVYVCCCRSSSGSSGVGCGVSLVNVP